VRRSASLRADESVYLHPAQAKLPGAAAMDRAPRSHGSAPGSSWRIPRGVSPVMTRIQL
jgi:hypothetical protein